MRVKLYSLRTEQVCPVCNRRYVRQNGLRHPRELDSKAVEAFLTRLAVRHHVASSTQNQALSVLLFLYHEILALELPWMQNVIQAKRAPRLPVMLSRGEALYLDR